MSASQYTAPPPSYQSKQPGIEEEARQPLLSGSPRAGTSGGAIYDQPEFGDLPDDFKYGVTVSESSLEIRNAFVRKVYSILCAYPFV
jgi:protein lifeguard